MILQAIVSFFIVAFGQPAWFPILGLLAAACGYAIFWNGLLTFKSRKKRFWVATFWFMAILLVQLSWFISHPYLYIYILWFVLSFLFALMFGVVSLFIDRGLLIVPALWTIFEWSKLFILSGYSWNPVGLAFGGSLYTLQLASIAGVFGLSFLVMFTNILALRNKKAWIVAVIAPYIVGAALFHYHSAKMEKHPNEKLHVVLVQTAFPIEEAMFFESPDHFVGFVTNEWKQILKITAKQHGKKIDLMALPEFVVPFGTYTFVFPYDSVVEEIKAIYGPEVEAALPPKELPFADYREGKWMVNNAFWVQTMANYFNAPVVAGLEDVDDLPTGGRAYFSAAIYFKPNGIPFEPMRYSKRVLVPMGEYIPFSFVQDLAARYGICGSFTCGQEAVAWPCAESKFGVSICYEETFGHLMRDNRLKGAEFLINITNDAWYPHSKLTSQHLEHARLRTVENGFPLLRACNTGITSAIDSIGRDVAVLAADAEDPESVSDSLYAEVSSYHYFTIYSILGDWLIIGFSLALIFIHRLFWRV